MCGRFTLRTPAGAIVEQFHLRGELQLPLRFNIAPSQPIAAVRQTVAGGERELAMLRWGLIPFWAKEAAIGNRMINARSETLAEKPSFRAAYKNRRCLIVADGYYEWQKRESGKQPYYFHRQDDGPFAFAGLWERWDKGPEPIESCTIITTDANELSRPIHDRMPVILSPEKYDLWLDPEFEETAPLQPLLQPYPSDDLVAEPVSTHVNRPTNDDPRCIEVHRELF